MIPDKIGKLCLKARRALEERDWTTARQLYLQALGQRSDLPDIHYGLGTVYFQLRELSSAIHHFQEVTRLDPQNARAYINLGVIFNLLEQPDKAIHALRRGIQQDPERFEGYYNLGLIYRRQGQTDLAIESFRETLRLNPRMADACLNLAKLYQEKGQLNRAQKQYEEALKLRPGWDKALEGMRSLPVPPEAEKPAPVVRPAAETAPAHPAVKANIDLDRTADPVVFQSLLATLNNATAVSEEAGRLLKVILVEEIEPALKELSSCLLNPGKAVNDLAVCLLRFEQALEHFRIAENAMKLNMDRLWELSEVFPFF